MARRCVCGPACKLALGVPLVLLALFVVPTLALAQAPYPPLNQFGTQVIPGQPLPFGEPGEGQNDPFDRPPSFETPIDEQTRGIPIFLSPAFWFVDPPPPGLGGTQPYFPFLVRQPDCSLSRYIIDLNGSIVDSTTQYQNQLHSMAGLASTPGKFASGCANPTIGIPSQMGAFIGTLADGTAIFDLISPDGMLVYFVNSVGVTSQDYPVITPGSGTIFGLTSTDINHDGNLDVIVASQTGTTGSLTVFLGDGMGGFSQTVVVNVNMPVAGSALGVTIDDLNGDGNMDLIAVTASNGTASGVHVFLGDGTGNFGADLPGPAAAGGQVAVTADFNGDSKKDIATSYGNILLGDGTGHFTAVAETVPVGQWNGLAAADFNGDKKIDLAFTNTSLATISLYFGNGDGTFTYSASYPTVVGPQSIQATDLDGDGNVDLFIGTAHGGYYFSDFNTQSMFASLLNPGNGVFQPSQAYLPSAYANTNFPGLSVYYDVADFNGDTKPDILTFDFESTGVSLSVLTGNGDGTFNRIGILTPVTEFTVPGSLVQVMAADVNGDTKADAIFAWNTGNGFSNISVATGKGDGTFNAPTDYTGLPLIVVAQMADINGDGKPDIVFIGQTSAATTSTGLYVMLNNGSGGFSAPTRIDAEPNMIFLAVADLNGDSRADIVVTTSGDSTTTPGTPGTAFVYLGNGNGTFQANTQLSVGSIFPGPVAIADVNGDGRPDIIIAATNLDLADGNVTTMLGNGDGTFQAPLVTSQPNIFPTAVLVTDVNGDSKADLVLGGCCGAAYNYVMPGNGDGTFAAEGSDVATHLWAGVSAQRLKLADLNNDGFPDLLMVSNGSVIEAFVSSAGARTFAASATALQSSASTINVGQSVTLTATVSAQSGTGIPTGTVNFLDGATSLGSVAANISAVAALSTSSLTVGPHSITAAYQGDPYFAASTSSAASVEVHDLSKIGTTTTLVPAPSTTNVGQSVTLTATVASQSGSGLATGMVNFKDGATTIGSGTLNGSGVATISTSTLAAGSHSLTGVYVGDVNFTGSTSSAVQLQVNLLASTTTLGALPTTANVGQNVSLTATVAPQSGTGTPSGTVKFLDGTASIGNGTLNGSGVATLSTSALAAGSHSITAAYQGDTTFATSTSSAASVQVNLIATTTTLQAAPNTATAGQSVTLTATVAPQSGTGTPTGTVKFFNGTTSLGGGTLVSGIASFTTSLLPVGTDGLTAAYQGDTTFATSTSSPAIPVQINPAPDFSISVSPGSQSVSAGGGTAYTLTLTALNGFNQAVTLSCAISASGTDCTPASSPVTVSGSTPVTVQVNVTTKAGAPPVQWQPNEPWWTVGFLAVMLAIYLFVFEQSRRRSLRGSYRLAFWAGAILIALYISGCGAPYSHKNSGGTPKGTYTVTFTATAGNTTHMTTASIVVQ